MTPPGSGPERRTDRARRRRAAGLLAAVIAAAWAGPVFAAVTPDSVAVTAPAPAPTPAAPRLAGVFRSDRVAHASLALTIGAGVGIVTDRPAAAAASAILVTVAKEIADPRVDRGDLAAGVLGAALAALLVAAVRD